MGRQRQTDTQTETETDRQTETAREALLPRKVFHSQAGDCCERREDEEIFPALWRCGGNSSGDNRKELVTLG